MPAAITSAKQVGALLSTILRDSRIVLTGKYGYINSAKLKQCHRGTIVTKLREFKDFATQKQVRRTSRHIS